MHDKKIDDRGRREVPERVGETQTWEIVPGPHTLRIHNTLLWKTLTFEAEPGAHVHFTVWNRAWSGYYVMMLWVGVAPLGFVAERGAPPDAEAAWLRSRAARGRSAHVPRPSSTLR